MNASPPSRPVHLAKRDDTEYEEQTVARVESDEGGWWLHFEDDGCFWCPERGPVPHAGSVARTYGRGPGYVVRGLDIDGAEVFWRSPEDQHLKGEIDNRNRDIERIRAYQREGRAKQDADYGFLVPIFRARIDGFRERKADFRWTFEAYELSCCVDALKIAARYRTRETIEAFYTLPWKEQQAAVPNLYDGHSGNSFAFACRLAGHYVGDPDLVLHEHGALCNLVGCNEYGCIHAMKEGTV